MSFNLVEAVKSHFSSDILSSAGSSLGESETGLQRAMAGLIPSVLTGVLNKAGSGDEGEVLGMAKDAARSGVLTHGGNLFDANLLSRGAGMLIAIFGNRSADVSNAVAGYSGITPPSAHALLSAVTPVALGVLGKKAESENMGDTDFASFLGTQKNSILGAIPSGLNLASALGVGSLAGVGSGLAGALSGAAGSIKDVTGRAQRATRERVTENGGGGGKWVLPVILALAVIGLIWFLTGRNAGEQAMPNIAGEPTADTQTATAPSETAPTGPESIKVALPNGTELDAYKGGIEDQLVAFLTDDSKKADKNTWFDFDNLNFETGSAKLTAESMKQIQNIHAIMGAFPNASIKIGGYTDKTGNDAANLKLSQQRADAVLAALKMDGAKASQLEGAEGYGSKFAKADATAPDEERKKDRRIAVNVRKK